jgi:hypothetical protein
MSISQNYGNKKFIDIGPRSDLAKKEDIAIANNYVLAQIERELAQIRGTQVSIS